MCSRGSSSLSHMECSKGASRPVTALAHRCSFTAPSCFPPHRAVHSTRARSGANFSQSVSRARFVCTFSIRCGGLHSRARVRAQVTHQLQSRGVLQWNCSSDHPYGITPGVRHVRSVRRVRRVKNRSQLLVCCCQVPEAEDREAVEKLSNASLRQQLKQLGADIKYVFERSELVGMLVEARRAARAKVVRVPLRQCTATLTSPKAYILVPLDVADEGFVDFALDTGASGALISPELRDRLGLSELSGSAVQGLGVTGMTLRQKVQLPSVRLGQQEVALREAIVNPLRSANLVEAGVGGMLGMEFLCQFDIELDFTKKQVAFYPAGSAQKGGLLDTTHFSTLTCTPLIGGLRSVMASINGGPGFQAVLDLATVFSVANWKAATMAGLQEVVETPIQGLGMDSSAIPIFKPAKPLMLQLGDEARGDDPVSIPTKALLVSDLPAFTILRLSEGPAALIGLDVLQQPRLILSLSTNKLHLELPAFPPEEVINFEEDTASPIKKTESPTAEQ